MGIQDHINVGDKFNHLTLVSDPHQRGTRWLAVFECICGVRKDILVYNAVRGKTKSCGCFGRARERIGPRTHGLSGTPTWHSYHGMLTRCYNERQKSFQYYGARGISVCDRWLTGFAVFVTDMGMRPPGMTLDRQDVNGNYSPENCRWATNREQALNRTNSRRITWNGITKTIKEWSDHTGFDRTALDVRIKLGWSTDDIFSITPVLGRNQYSTD